MPPIGRREFLRRGSASLAGAIIAGPLVEHWLGADAIAADAPTIAGLTPHLIDDLATIVADLQRKFPYASALYAAQSGIGITRDRNGKRVSESGFPSRGLSLRVFDGNAFHEAAVGSVATDPVRAAARDLARRVAVAKERYKIEPFTPHGETWSTTLAQDPAAVSLADRVALVDQEFERVNNLDPRIRSARATTDVSRIHRVFVDRHRRLASETTMISHSAGLFGFDQGKPGFAFERRTGQGGLELARLTDESIERLRRHFAESFGTEAVPAGEYDVVFAPPVSGLLAHESFGHGVEMDQFVKDRAKAREFLGKKVASDIVTLLDDPSLPGIRGSYPFDDEGALAAPTRIIVNGVFVQPLTDLMSATFLKTPRTPNGRAQAWDRKVYARMSNTFFAKGTSTKEEVLASLQNGLYVEGFRNGIEDPQGWGIQFTASTAREYQNGKPTGRIFAPATITGYVPEILSNITMIANDFELEPGTCGKGHKEYVPVTSGGPHLRTRARVS
jgi:TldD protein